MNQGKLEVVKQEMGRVKISILGNQWTKMDVMTLISTTVGKNPLEEVECPHNQQKNPKCKKDRMSLFVSKATIQYHSNPSLCPKHWCQRCWSWKVLWRPLRPRDLPGGSDGKVSIYNEGDPGSIPGLDPLEKEMATTPVLLPGKSHEWRSVVGYSPLDCKESDTTEQLHFHFHKIF